MLLPQVENLFDEQYHMENKFAKYGNPKNLHTISNKSICPLLKKKVLTKRLSTWHIQDKAVKVKKRNKWLIKLPVILRKKLVKECLERKLRVVLNKIEDCPNINAVWIYDRNIGKYRWREYRSENIATSNERENVLHESQEEKSDTELNFVITDIRGNASDVFDFPLTSDAETEIVTDFGEEIIKSENDLFEINEEYKPIYKEEITVHINSPDSAEEPINFPLSIVPSEIKWNSNKNEDTQWSFASSDDLEIDLGQHHTETDEDKDFYEREENFESDKIYHKQIIQKVGKKRRKESVKKVPTKDQHSSMIFPRKLNKNQRHDSPYRQNSNERKKQKTSKLFKEVVKLTPSYWRARNSMRPLKFSKKSENKRKEDKKHRPILPLKLRLLDLHKKSLTSNEIKDVNDVSPFEAPTEKTIETSKKLLKKCATKKNSKKQVPACIRKKTSQNTKPDVVTYRKRRAKTSSSTKVASDDGYSLLDQELPGFNWLEKKIKKGEIKTTQRNNALNSAQDVTASRKVNKMDEGVPEKSKKSSEIVTEESKQLLPEVTDEEKSNCILKLSEKNELADSSNVIPAVNGNAVPGEESEGEFLAEGLYIVIDEDTNATPSETTCVAPSPLVSPDIVDKGSSAIWKKTDECEDTEQVLSVDHSSDSENRGDHVCNNKSCLLSEPQRIANIKRTSIENSAYSYLSPSEITWVENPTITAKSEEEKEETKKLDSEGGLQICQNDENCAPINVSNSYNSELAKSNPENQSEVHLTDKSLETISKEKAIETNPEINDNGVIQTNSSNCETLDIESTTIQRETMKNNINFELQSLDTSYCNQEKQVEYDVHSENKDIEHVCAISSKIKQPASVIIPNKMAELKQNLISSPLTNEFRKIENENISSLSTHSFCTEECNRSHLPKVGTEESAFHTLVSVSTQSKSPSVCTQNTSLPSRVPSVSPNSLKQKENRFTISSILEMQPCPDICQKSCVKINSEKPRQSTTPQAEHILEHEHSTATPDIQQKSTNQDELINSYNSDPDEIKVLYEKPVILPTSKPESTPSPLQSLPKSKSNESLAESVSNSPHSYVSDINRSSLTPTKKKTEHLKSTKPITSTPSPLPYIRYPSVITQESNDNEMHRYIHESEINSVISGNSPQKGAPSPGYQNISNYHVPPKSLKEEVEYRKCELMYLDQLARKREKEFERLQNIRKSKIKLLKLLENRIPHTLSKEYGPADTTEVYELSPPIKKTTPENWTNQFPSQTSHQNSNQVSVIQPKYSSSNLLSSTELNSNQLAMAHGYQPYPPSADRIQYELNCFIYSFNNKMQERRKELNSESLNPREMEVSYNKGSTEKQLTNQPAFRVPVNNSTPGSNIARVIPVTHPEPKVIQPKPAKIVQPTNYVNKDISPNVTFRATETGIPYPSSSNINTDKPHYSSYSFQSLKSFDSQFCCPPQKIPTTKSSYNVNSTTTEARLELLSQHQQRSDILTQHQKRSEALSQQRQLQPEVLNQHQQRPDMTSQQQQRTEALSQHHQRAEILSQHQHHSQRHHQQQKSREDSSTNNAQQTLCRNKPWPSHGNWHQIQNQKLISSNPPIVPELPYQPEARHLPHSYWTVPRPGVNLFGTAQSQLKILPDIIQPREDVMGLVFVDASKTAHACSYCNGNAIFLCSACKKAWYCGRECQKRSWIQHSSVCLANR